MSSIERPSEDLETPNVPPPMTTVQDIRNLALAGIAGALIGSTALPDYGHMGWMSGTATALLIAGLWQARS